MRVDMFTRSAVAIITPVMLMLLTVLNTGCGPRPPVDYQQLQIQDTEESQGYDVYLYVAINPNSKRGEIEALLKWFDEVKFAKVNKMRVFVWDNPQAALINNLSDLMGSINVDRSNKIFELVVSDQVKEK
jgi:hypothetical protein